MEGNRWFVLAGSCFAVFVPVILYLAPGTPPAPSPRPLTDADVTQGAPCHGMAIPVSYPFTGPDSSSPFECEPYCGASAKSPHYILYSNGYGAQCGISSCKDLGEDGCITCAVPDDARLQYGLQPPTDQVSCIQEEETPAFKKK